MQLLAKLFRELGSFQVKSYFSLYQVDKDKHGCGSSTPNQSMQFAPAVLDAATPRHGLSSYKKKRKTKHRE